MSELGYIRIDRSILDNPIVCKDAEHYAVWNYLLLKATHKEMSAMFKGEKIILQPGQLITGREKIAEKFKMDPSKVQRILKKFEIEQQIEQQTSNKNRLISIKNWEKYQIVNNKTTTSEQQLNTNNNVINININNLLNKYKYRARAKSFFDKRKILKDIKQDPLYKELNKEEQDELINIVLSNSKEE